MCLQIDNKDLKDSDIPSEDSSWEQISQSALSFSVYSNMEYEEWAIIPGKIYESFEKNQLMKHSLTEMRACLFIFQRQERLNREYSSVESVKMDIMRALVKAIRIKVSSKLLD